MHPTEPLILTLSPLLSSHIWYVIYVVIRCFHTKCPLNTDSTPSPFFKLKICRRLLISLCLFPAKWPLTTRHSVPNKQPNLTQLSPFYTHFFWDTCHTRWAWGNNEDLSLDSESSHNVLERGTWVCPSGYTKASQTTPWRLRSKP